MLDSVLLASALGQGCCYGGPGADWRRLVHMDKSYAADHLPRLAEPVRLVPRVVADEFPHVNRVIRYESKGVEIEEVAEPAPSLGSSLSSYRALPDDVEPVPRAYFLKVLEVVDALKEHIRRKLRVPHSGVVSLLRLVILLPGHPGHPGHPQSLL